MKFVLRFFALVFCYLISGLANSQSPSFIVPPNKVVTSPSFSFTALPGSPSGDYLASNAGFDNDGNIKFFIKDNNVYSATGVVSATLPALISGGITASVMTPDLLIIPVPGTDCYKFHVIYTRYNATLDVLICGYLVVTASGATPTLSGTGILHTVNGRYGPITATALSSSHTRYVYCLTHNAVRRYTLGTSIGSGLNVGTTATMPGVTFGSRELELSKGSGKLVWGIQSQLNVITLNGSGTLSAFNTYAVTGATSINGIEWDAAAQKIFVTTNAGILRITPGVSQSTVTGTSNYTISFLEKGTNGLIYAVEDNTAKLGVINAAGTSISATTNPSINSKGIWFGSNDHFTLPNQIDNDNDFGGPDKGVVTNCCPNSNTTTIGYPAVAGCSYSWTNGAGTTLGITSPAASSTIVYTTVTQTFKLVRSCPCGDVVDYVNVFAGAMSTECCVPDPDLAPGGPGFGDHILAYPNPASQQLTIAHGMPKSTITLIDALGKTCYTTVADEYENSTVIDLGKFAAGYYTVVVSDQTTTKQVNVIVEEKK